MSSEMAAKPPVIPELYTGEKSWDEWIDHFDSVAEVCGWDAANKLKLLHVRLSGRAGTAFRRLPEATRASFDLATAALRSRFEPESKKELYRTELLTRRKKQNEGWAVFGEDLKILADKAYACSSSCPRPCLCQPPRFVCPCLACLCPACPCLACPCLAARVYAWKEEMPEVQKKLQGHLYHCTATVENIEKSFQGLTIAPKDTASPEGLFEFCVMPFGLCNAPATFQRLMGAVLAGLQRSTCLVYIDDLIIPGKTFSGHLSHLRQVFLRLREAGLKLKPRKCNLCSKEVEFLGHFVGAEGVRTDPTKTEKVATWPVPTSKLEVQQFLGLANYYRRFVKDFATVAKPLHLLTEKTAKFQWTQQAFESSVSGW